jgi:hypothetical protein
MVDKHTTPRNVVNFGSYRQARRVSAEESAKALVAAVLAVSGRSCRHCGAALGEGESEDECSSAFNDMQRPPTRFRATPER